MITCNWVRYVAALAAIWAISNSSSSVRAEDDAAGNAAAPVTNAGAAKKPAGKDPTASAFALPSGAKLNAKQQAAYDQLKADKQPELRQAIDDLQNTKSGATAQAAKKVRDLRAEIRKKINDILYPVSTPSSGGNDAAAGRTDSSAPSYGYGVPYGYNPYWSYGGYYPYLYRDPRTTDGKAPGARGGTPGKQMPPPRQQASRPAGGAAQSGGAKR